MNLYNEIDPFAAAWIERLVEAGHLPPGRVDRRSIADLRGADLDGATQAHRLATGRALRGTGPTRRIDG